MQTPYLVMEFFAQHIWNIFFENLQPFLTRKYVQRKVNLKTKDNTDNDCGICLKTRKENDWEQKGEKGTSGPAKLYT